MLSVSYASPWRKGSNKCLAASQDLSIRDEFHTFLRMALLQNMPPIVITPAELIPFGRTWTGNGSSLSRTPPNSSTQLGNLFDAKVGAALAVMLGNIPIVVPNMNNLIPSIADCVE